MRDLKSYSSYFYELQLSESAKSAASVLPIINELVNPKSIIDVGCGVGAWLKAWKSIKKDVEVLGLDASFVDKSMLLIDSNEEFKEVDLNFKIPTFDKKFDLAMCLEVAEHLNEERADSLVLDLIHLSDIILFSAAIPGQEGTDHRNEQYLSYWVDKFESVDYKCYDIIRPQIWNENDISWWFRQNIVFFIKPGKAHKIEELPHQSFYNLDLVHKELLQHKISVVNKLYILINNKKSYISKIKNFLSKCEKRI